MHIPQVAPWLGEEEAAAVGEVIADNWITEGPRTAEFSRRLNALMDAPYGVFAPNGTLALYLGLRALGIGPGDEVIVPDITFVASANAVVMAGATPVFAEVSATNYQIDVADCERVCSTRTRAIMPVHLWGMAANMEAVMAFARRHDLLVIEDAAQAIGVRYRGQHTGTFGDVGCFSFFADKTLTTGEGGYVVCRDPAVYERLLLLRNQGRRERGAFIHPEIGFNFRITDMQAAVGLAQLAKLGTIIERKRAILAWYQRGLADCEAVRFPALEPGSTYVPFRAVLLCPDAQTLMAHLAAHGVQPRSFFFPLHQQPCFAHLGLDDRHYPNALAGYRRGVLLPISPTLTEAQVLDICVTIAAFYRR